MDSSLRRPHAAAVLEAQRLGKRPYSLTALQRYSACPYQFLLSAIYRLEPLEEPTPVQRLDPLTKGGLFHAMQAAFFRARAAANALPGHTQRTCRTVSRPSTT